MFIYTKSTPTIYSKVYSISTVNCHSVVTVKYKIKNVKIDGKDGRTKCNSGCLYIYARKLQNKILYTVMYIKIKTKQIPAFILTLFFPFLQILEY